MSPSWSAARASLTPTAEPRRPPASAVCPPRRPVGPDALRQSQRGSSGQRAHLEASLLELIHLRLLLVGQNLLNSLVLLLGPLAALLPALVSRGALATDLANPVNLLAAEAESLDGRADRIPAALRAALGECRGADPEERARDGDRSLDMDHGVLRSSCPSASPALAAVLPAAARLACSVRRKEPRKGVALRRQRGPGGPVTGWSWSVR